MIRRLIILLLIVGCKHNTGSGSDNNNYRQYTHYGVTINITDIHYGGYVQLYGEVINTTDELIDGNLNVTADWYSDSTLLYYCGHDTEHIGYNLGVGDTLEFDMIYGCSSTYTPFLHSIHMWTRELKE